MRALSVLACAATRPLVAARRTVASATAAVALLAAVAAPAAQAQLVAYPLPGTTTASARTQISFRGVAPGDIGTVTVTGSRSGRHAGALRAHSDRLGASFVPRTPFRAGERVTVRARGLSYGFTVARRPPATTPPPGPPPSAGLGAVQRFATRTDLVPPAVTLRSSRPGQAPGYVFVGAKTGRGQDGPMILDSQANLVWFKAMPNRELAADFKVQTYQGQPVLTWWQGRLAGGEGQGEGVIYDTSYRPVRRVRAGNGYRADVHEFTITPDDTALLIAYDRVERDLSSLGGRGTVVEAVIQEVDIATGLVVFEWHSVGNIAFSESNQAVPTAGGGWDYVHPNSVALDADGDFILSARHTDTVYKIDRATGRIEWRLGGERSDFKLGTGAHFSLQHDARPLPDGSVTLFDNSSPAQRKRSRAITIALDTEAMTATLTSALTNPLGVLSATQGSAQRLPNGGTLVGWGSQRYITEHDASGNVVFDAAFSRGNDSYRAYRFEWAGRPARPPAVVAARDGDRVRVRVSWNGATDVASWEVWAGPSATQLTRVKAAAKTGFETAISVLTDARSVQVRALDAAGAALGESRAVSVS